MPSVRFVGAWTVMLFSLQVRTGRMVLPATSGPLPTPVNGVRVTRPLAPAAARKPLPVIVICRCAAGVAARLLANTT